MLQCLLVNHSPSGFTTSAVHSGEMKDKNLLQETNKKKKRSYLLTVDRCRDLRCICEVWMFCVDVGKLDCN